MFSAKALNAWRAAALWRLRPDCDFEQCSRVGGLAMQIEALESRPVPQTGKTP
jgi:hypothetical protein